MHLMSKKLGFSMLFPLIYRQFAGNLLMVYVVSGNGIYGNMVFIPSRIYYEVATTYTQNYLFSPLIYSTILHSRMSAAHFQSF